MWPPAPVICDVVTPERLPRPPRASGTAAGREAVLCDFGVKSFT